MKTDRGYPTKKLKPDAQKAKLDKVSKPPKGIEYLKERVTKKQPARKKKA